jgi:hypothetical protein
MLIAVRSYLRYYKYFWLRFLRDGLDWGRENLVGFLLSVAILATQIRFGVLQPGSANAEFWSIALPYAILAAAWFLFHLSATAWRIDHERAEREGPPLKLSPISTRSSNQLLVSLNNLGQTDEFFVEVTSIAGLDADTCPELPSPARVVNGRITRAGVVKIPEKGYGRVELAKLPNPKEQGELRGRPTLTVYLANTEYQGLLRWKSEPTELLERVVIGVRIQSVGTGRRVSASFVIAGSYGSKYLYSEIHRFEGSTSYPLPASPDP